MVKVLKIWIVKDSKIYEALLPSFTYAYSIFL